MGALALILLGCSRDEQVVEKPVEPPSYAPVVYMNDPEFRRQLAEKRKELQAIIKERAPLAARMQELVKEHGENLAALQKIPEWGELHQKVTALNAKYEEVRKRQLAIAGQRLSPAANTQSVAAVSAGKAAVPAEEKVSK